MSQDLQKRDFEYYLENKEHRDFGRWKNRDHWFAKN